MEDDFLINCKHFNLTECFDILLTFPSFYLVFQLGETYLGLDSAADCVTHLSFFQMEATPTALPATGLVSSAPGFLFGLTNVQLCCV